VGINPSIAFGLLVGTMACHAPEPRPDLGFRVMLQAVQTGRMYDEGGGFDYRPDLGDRERVYFPDPDTLLRYFAKLPASVRSNGIWVTKGWDNVYSHGELLLVDRLAVVCRQYAIPLFVGTVEDRIRGYKRLSEHGVGLTPNNRLKLTARGRSVAAWSPISRAAA